MSKRFSLKGQAMGASFVRRAFTLVELMIVIAIIGILVALLVPGLGVVSSVADQMRCATNLHRLWQAVSMRTADETSQVRKRPLRATAWPSQVLPYLESGSTFMICPVGGESLSEGGASAGSQDTTWGSGDGAASGGASGGGGDDWTPSYARISDLADFKTEKGGGVFYFIALEEGRYCLKLSEEQYAAARAANLLNNSDNADNIRDKFNTAYQIGANRHAYWLCIEGVGGDDDFKEAMIHVTEQKDGSFSLEISTGTHGSTNSLVSKPEGVKLADLPPNISGVQVTLKTTDDPEPAATAGGLGVSSLYSTIQADDPIANSVVSTSYAMNVYYPQMNSKGAKILLMDYTKYLAYVNDDWGGEKMDPDQTGVPIFARHGGRMNVLYADGSVAAEDPKDVNPADPARERALWDP
jgi:prepilin-type N-terminal cleavage/methylation domain-containing protein/prepilin-type processing-associated H-X9-DG protein